MESNHGQAAIGKRMGAKIRTMDDFDDKQEGNHPETVTQHRLGQSLRNVLVRHDKREAHGLSDDVAR